jgi:RNA 3'-terminal phosphate cyclase
VRSYLSNLEQVLGEELNLNNQSSYINAIKGYYLEEAETSAIQEAFDKAIKVFNPSFTSKTEFAVNIGGENISMDIKFNLDALLPKETTIEVKGSTKIDEAQTVNNIKNMANKSIKEFGAQVKSRLP